MLFMMNHFPLLSRFNRKYHFVTFFFFLSSLSDSLWLGTRNRFNEQLNSTSARYTYFVPRDKAWKGLENEFPSVYKKLFMPEFQYHVSHLPNMLWNLVQPIIPPTGSCNLGTSFDRQRPHFHHEWTERYVRRQWSHSQYCSWPAENSHSGTW